MKRDTKLIAAFGTAALVSATILGIRVVTGQPPPVMAVTARVAEPSSQKVFSLQFVGDTMLADGAQPLLDEFGYDHVFRPSLRRLLDADFVMANLESPLTDEAADYNEGKDYSYASKPPGAMALRRAGVDAVSLANNHAMDAGPTGLSDTLAWLDRNGVGAIGAGQTLNRAEQPLIINTPTQTVGVVSMGENFGSALRAEEAQPGTLVFDPGRIQRSVDLARAAGADRVIAFVHWGDNYMDINAEQRYWARMLVDAGFDAIVGAGPHIAQPVEVIDGVPVLFSIGNFVFGSPGRFAGYGKPGLGLVATLEIADDAPIGVRLRCLETDNEKVDYRPHECTTARARRFLPTLHSGIVMEGREAVLRPAAPASPSAG